MTESNPKELLLDLLLQSARGQSLKKVVLSKPADQKLVRSVITLRKIGGRPVLQLESFLADNKAIHENLDLENRARIAEILDGYGQINLFTTAGDCEYKVSKSQNSVLIGGSALSLRLQSAQALELFGNNREKKHILSGDEPFLKLLGVSDQNGRVKDKKQSKFRQINRFLEIIRDCEDSLPKEGVLRICDLCCGKSYLSFAAYHYFANVLGRSVKMTGVDLKEDVIDYCNSVARALHFDGLTFLSGDVGKYDAGEHVHLVISLHACDTATDLVLDRALAFDADVILSTPCCHHELNHTLDCPALSFIAEHSMLRQKFCDAATDALRLKRLEASGYSVSALELIDPEETPKNILLRAIKKKQFDKTSPEAKKLEEEYRAAKRFLTGKDF